MKIPLRQYWALSASYLRPQWRGVTVMAVLLLSGIALQLVSPLILRYFIDTARAGGAQTHLTIAGALFRRSLYRKRVAPANLRSGRDVSQRERRVDVNQPVAP
ncbi:MAG TPA: hypothetical protein VF221_12250 [Chloroflexota bacterium]